MALSIPVRERINWRAEEAHIEAVAFMDEVRAACVRIVDAITGLPVPCPVAINEANRLAYRAEAARRELLALQGSI